MDKRAAAAAMRAWAVAAASLKESWSVDTFGSFALARSLATLYGAMK